MLFSVVIPAYNSAGFIQAAIASVRLASSSRDYEVLIVDDCSDDLEKLRSVVQEFSEVKLLEKPVKTNAADSRNIGLALAQTRYIFFLDSDDRFTANAVDRRIRLHDTERAGVIFGNYISVSGNKHRPSSLAPYRGGDIAAYLFGGAGDFRSSTVSIFRDCYSNTLFDPASNKHQDWIYAILCYRNDETIVFDNEPSAMLQQDRASRMSASMNIDASKYFVNNYLSVQYHINTFSKCHWLTMIASRDRVACQYFFSIYRPDSLPQAIRYLLYRPDSFPQAIRYLLYRTLASGPMIGLSSVLIALVRSYKRRH